MWDWLLAQRLIAQDGRQSQGYVQITTKGREAARDPSFRDRLRAVELLGRPLHPKLEKARRTFEQGDYDTVIHQAFKAVEVAVREATELPATLVGLDPDDAGLPEERRPAGRRVFSGG